MSIDRTARSSEAFSFSSRSLLNSATVPDNNPAPVTCASLHCFSIRVLREISSLSILAIQSQVHAFSPSFNAAESPRFSGRRTILNSSGEFFSYSSTTLVSSGPSGPSHTSTNSLGRIVCASMLLTACFTGIDGHQNTIIHRTKTPPARFPFHYTRKEHNSVSTPSRSGMERREFLPGRREIIFWTSDGSRTSARLPR